MKWLAVSDLHGRSNRYRALFKEVERRIPPAVLMGGDLFPRGSCIDKFLDEYLFEPLKRLREIGIGTRFAVILGNDDPRENEQLLIDADRDGILDYIPMKKIEIEGITVVGYPFVTPSPFRLKDWERYDMDRTLRPGCIPPENGIHTISVRETELGHRTILEDMNYLSSLSDPSRTLYLFHSPPFETNLDVVGSRFIENPHIGSEAIRKFIDTYQPPVTLHGHIHESYEMSGFFHQRLGRTLSISTCGIAKDLVLISFDPKGKDVPVREIIK
jgi:Icc-related predicted phosphoesterase